MIIMAVVVLLCQFVHVRCITACTGIDLNLCKQLLQFDSDNGDFVAEEFLVNKIFEALSYH